MSTSNLKEFERKLVSEYLRYGSVDEVFKLSSIKLPISYAHYQRILDKWGIIKSAGPNNSFSELLIFLSNFSKEKVSLELFYKRMPRRFQTSLVTLYRVLFFIKEGITRRIATALIITPHNSKEKILVGNDISTPILFFGKPYGSVTIPVCFSRRKDSRKIAVTRVLQHEVFTNKVIEGKLPNIVPRNPKPFMFLDIADIRVEVFHINLPKNLSSINDFSSFKIEKFRFVDIDSIILGRVKNMRAGLKEVVLGYKNYLNQKYVKGDLRPYLFKSELNCILSN